MIGPSFTALGVSEEIAALGLKGNKKKRARKLDEDFTVSSIEQCTQCETRTLIVVLPKANFASNGGERCAKSCSSVATSD
jgi:hypothetical protein